MTGPTAERGERRLDATNMTPKKEKIRRYGFLISMRIRGIFLEVVINSDCIMQM
ncbi:hypothetical protein HMPREF0765_3861 [Sphingobacterium spiritivorum ATCC 33300]|uniref:Uncharacterized protein n=1 Tax=Sphingobacterium spiritivorum ATCC 33300 TaxID=525372 RepID=C2G2Q5_SPHSI|nr:hypothetical protein HMPREF0765_3861 [Sphingobacterium spiritivorum ATCC 33300]